jgi:hypothetical protein
MSFEDKEAQLGLLLTEMQNEPQDKHEIYLRIRQTLQELRGTGMPLPADLVQFERDLEAEFEADMKEADAARAGRIQSVLMQRARLTRK